MGSTENGNYVTRAELSAHLTPMRSDISEIKGDVKTLLARDAGVQAVSKYRRIITSHRLSWFAIFVSILTAVSFHLPNF